MPPQPIVQLKNTDNSEELLDYFSLQASEEDKNHNTYQSNMEEEVFESFNKLKNSSLSFEDLKTSVISSRFTQEIFVSILMLFIGCFSVTGVYIGTLNLLGLFNIHPILSLGLFASGLGVFYSSSFIISKLFDNKFYTFNKEEKLAQNFIKKFNSSDTTAILPAIKNDLTAKLEKTKIKEINPYVYNYIAERIHRLDGDFNKLKYKLETKSKLGKYSFVPFREFLKTIEEIENELEDAEDIKVINT